MKQNWENHANPWVISPDHAIISNQWIVVHLQEHSTQRAIPNDSDELVDSNKNGGISSLTESDVWEQTFKWCTIAFEVDQYADVCSVTDDAESDLPLSVCSKSITYLSKHFCTPGTNPTPQTQTQQIRFD